MDICRIDGDASPLIAAAIHDGHTASEEVGPLFALNDLERLREEDPHTGKWAGVAPKRIIGLRSRFEVDLNRPRDKAVYLTPEDAWGLRVWNCDLPAEIVAQSLAAYDRFYAEVHTTLERAETEFGRFFIFDLHTYNHRREGPNAPPADAALNPEVNIGTGTMDRQQWAPVIDRFIDDLRAFDFLGRKLDVRENIKFRGGHFGRWTHANFPETGCALAIEFKKFFMDEWTGEPNNECVDAVGDALSSTVAGILEELKRL